ncbi:ROK family protein [Jeotgalibacillus terrae]|uniref:ROK family protein n=1 Tax=Jeotgalibacillus terrae TaxID=587735 RepID=A0ABW5ZGB3_9BACL|nr:ROK family protein [Jeotgalibacillus terrae]MBM7580128.1 glucokinase [Jeotgalibacillus terrae]
MHAVGVDVGGTNVRAAVVDENGQVLDLIKEPTPAFAPDVLPVLVNLIDHYLKHEKYEISAAGIGLSGVIDPITGVITGAGDTMPGWLGTEVGKYLKEKLPIPVTIDNDVNVAGLGEFINRKLNGHPVHQFVYLSIGTGLGGAIIHNGRIVSGNNGGAGEIGHSILYPDGLACGCGKMGCAEKYVSGTALNQLAKEISSDCHSYELLELYQSGDAKAVRLIRQFLRDLGTVMVNIQAYFDPEEIIIGGGLSSAFYLMKADLKRILLSLGHQQEVNWSIAADGENIGVIGAAYLTEPADLSQMR